MTEAIESDVAFDLADEGMSITGAYLSGEDLINFYSYTITGGKYGKCWHWTGRVERTGGTETPRFYDRAKGQYDTAARIAWKDAGLELVTGDLLYKRKDCIDPLCVNPKHRRKFVHNGTKANKAKGKKVSIIHDVEKTEFTPVAGVVEVIEEVQSEAQVTKKPVFSDSQRLDLICKSITTTLSLPFAGIIYTPDAECCGYGRDVKEAADDALAKYLSKYGKLPV